MYPNPTTYWSNCKLVAERAIFRRQQENDRLQKWEDVARYYDLEGTRAARHSLWTSEETFNNSMKAFEEVNAKDNAKKNLTLRRKKLRDLLESEDKQYAMELMELRKKMPVSKVDLEKSESTTSEAEKESETLDEEKINEEQEKEKATLLELKDKMEELKKKESEFKKEEYLHKDLEACQNQVISVADTWRENKDASLKKRQNKVILKQQQKKMLQLAAIELCNELTDDLSLIKDVFKVVEKLSEILFQDFSEIKTELYFAEEMIEKQMKVELDRQREISDLFNEEAIKQSEIFESNWGKERTARMEVLLKILSSLKHIIDTSISENLKRLNIVVHEKEELLKIVEEANNVLQQSKINNASLTESPRQCPRPTPSSSKTEDMVNALESLKISSPYQRSCPKIAWE